MVLLEASCLFQYTTHQHSFQPVIKLIFFCDWRLWLKSRYCWQKNCSWKSSLLQSQSVISYWNKEMKTSYEEKIFSVQFAQCGYSRSGQIDIIRWFLRTTMKQSLMAAFFRILLYIGGPLIPTPDGTGLSWTIISPHVALPVKGIVSTLLMSHLPRKVYHLVLQAFTVALHTAEDSGFRMIAK